MAPNYTKAAVLVDTNQPIEINEEIGDLESGSVFRPLIVMDH